MHPAKFAAALLGSLLLFGTGAAALADIPPYRPPQPNPPPQPQPQPDPKPAPKPEAEANKLVIKPTPGSPEAILTIPRKLLPAAAATPKAAAGFSPTQTVVAGVAMTAAISLLGLHLVRRRGGAVALTVTAAILVGGVAGSLVLANSAPLPPDQPPKYADEKIDWSKAEWTPGQFGLRKIVLTIRVVDDGDAMELRVDPALLEPGPGAKPPK